MASLTIENYVKAIYELCARNSDQPAATGQLAQRLGVSPGTVTSMLKTLSDSQLAQYKPYEGVRLTESGQALALRVLRRHRIIEMFLVHTLDLSWDLVHEEAENMEHAVSDLLIDRIDEYLGRPEVDPHGDPIPRADGTIQAPRTQGLDQWPSGARFRLVRVLDQSPEFLRFLTASGLNLDARGAVTSRSDEAGTITLEIGEGATMTLSREAAAKLLVAGP